jgi:hypothetical protein
MLMVLLFWVTGRGGPKIFVFVVGFFGIVVDAVVIVLRVRHDSGPAQPVFGLSNLLSSTLEELGFVI